MTARPLALLALLATALLAPRSPAQEAVPLGTVWHEQQLDNGLRVVVVPAPAARDQAVFTLLPWGFLAEDAGRPQQAHLVEHLLVRSSHPDQTGPSVDGLLINGETMALSQRLESFGPLETWREAVAHHRAWLSLATAEPDLEALTAVVERERLNALTELDNTLLTGQTHKWALSAWNQVVRHGAEHVALRQAVSDVRVEDLLQAVQARLPLGPQVTVVSVGPAPVDEVLAELTAVLGDLPRRDWSAPPASRPVEEVLEPGPRRATWDLPRLQYMVWYPLPDRGPSDRVAADALAFLISSRLQQRGGLDQLKVAAFASADLVTPEGRFLLVSASAPSSVDLGKLSSLIEEVVASLASLPEARLLIADMATQLGSWPDFADLRGRMAGRPGLEWIEAQQMLFLLYAQQNMGLDAATLPGAYGRLTPELLSELAAGFLTPARRSTLVLSSRA